jgi:hypothetical protein
MEFIIFSVVFIAFAFGLVIFSKTKRGKAFFNEKKHSSH